MWIKLSNGMKIMGLTAAVGIALPVVAGEAGMNANVKTSTSAKVHSDGSAKSQTQAHADANASANARPQLTHASKLIGRKVVNAKGETVAEVKDLILSANGREVQHAVLSAQQGGVLGVGGKTITRAVAWSSLQAGGNNTLQLGLLQSADLNAIGSSVSAVTGASASAETDGSILGEAVDTTTGAANTTGKAVAGAAKTTGKTVVDAGKTTGRTVTGAVDNVLSDTVGIGGKAEANAEADAHIRARPRHVANIIGMRIHDQGNRAIARIDDIIVDQRTGAAAYALIAFEGDADANLRNKMAAVPMTAIDFTNQQGARLETSASSLSQITFDRGRTPDLIDSDYIRRIDSTFGQPVNWDVYGYGESKTRLDAESR